MGHLGGKGGFKVLGREFDGAYGVGNAIWYEAKSGLSWEKYAAPCSEFSKFMSDMGERLSIARKNGASLELHSNSPIPNHAKEWMEKKGIGYLEY